MNSKFPDLFGALSAPFDQGEVKQIQGKGGRRLDYVTARSVMNRLDEVVGPESWWDEYVVARDNSTLCKLTIRLPDGSTVTKQGIGVTSANIGEDAEKGGESDALKRAAAKLGVGRYLYKDGVPRHGPAERREEPRPADGPAEPRPKPFWTWHQSAARKLGINDWHLLNHFCKRLDADGYGPMRDWSQLDNKDKIAECRKLWEGHDEWREWFRAAARSYREEHQRSEAGS